MWGTLRQSPMPENPVALIRRFFGVPVHSKELGRTGSAAGQAWLCRQPRIADVDRSSSRLPGKAAATHQHMSRCLGRQRTCKRWTLLQRTPEWHHTPTRPQNEIASMCIKHRLIGRRLQKAKLCEHLWKSRLQCTAGLADLSF